MKKILLISLCIIAMNAFAQNVGIGTSTPAFKLDVNGNLNIRGDSSIYIYGSPVINIHGSNNLFLGVGSGTSNTTGYANVANGSQSLNSNTTGYFNTASGVQALSSNITGAQNSAFGHQALLINTSGFGNTAIGEYSLPYNTVGGWNTGVGINAMMYNSSGNNNLAIGTGALYTNISGSNATAIGTNAMYYAYNTSTSFTNYNVAVGFEALKGSVNSTNNTGNYNTAIGYQTLKSNTSGNQNTANGYLALAVNNTGGSNTAIGYQALTANTGGNGNSAHGLVSLYNNTTGSYNTACGYYALYTNISGSNNTCVGYQADANANNYSNSSGFGNGTLITASNQIRIGNSSVSSIGGQVGWTTISDARVKKNIQSNVPGLDFILKLQPVTYNIDVTTLDKLLRPDGFKNQPTQQELDSKTTKSKIVYTGFIAQDVEATAKQVGYDFSGVDAPKNDKDVYGIRYAEFVVPLVKAVQEMNKQNQDQLIMIDRLKKENEEIKNRLLALELKK